jgi:hypothetical protein
MVHTQLAIAASVKMLATLEQRHNVMKRMTITGFEQYDPRTEPQLNLRSQVDLSLLRSNYLKFQPQVEGPQVKYICRKGLQNTPYGLAVFWSH